MRPNGCWAFTAKSIRLNCFHIDTLLPANGSTFLAEDFGNSYTNPTESSSRSITISLWFGCCAFDTEECRPSEKSATKMQEVDAPYAATPSAVAIVSPIVAGLSATEICAARIAAIFESAEPSPPLMMAPA